MMTLYTQMRCGPDSGKSCMSHWREVCTGESCDPSSTSVALAPELFTMLAFLLTQPNLFRIQRIFPLGTFSHVGLHSFVSLLLRRLHQCVRLQQSIKFCEQIFTKFSPESFVSYTQLVHEAKTALGRQRFEITFIA